MHLPCDLTETPDEAEATVKGCVASTENQFAEKDNCRQFVCTGHHLRLVLMALRPGEDVGVEAHTIVATA